MGAAMSGTKEGFLRYVRPEQPDCWEGCDGGSAPLSLPDRARHQGLGLFAAIRCSLCVRGCPSVLSTG